MNGNRTLSLMFSLVSMSTEIAILAVSLLQLKPSSSQVTDSYFTKITFNGLRAVSFVAISLQNFRSLSQIRLEESDIDASDIDETIPLIQRTRDSDRVPFRDYLILLPFLWPSNIYMQVMMAMSVLLALFRRALLLSIPLGLGAIMNVIEAGQVPWRETLKYGLLLLLEPMLQILWNYLWDKVKKSCQLHLAIHSFRHIMTLDTDYHFSTNTGEAISDLQSSSAVTRFLELLAFSAAPTIVSLAGSLLYLWVYYDIFYAFLIAYGAICYLWATCALTPLTEETRSNVMEDIITYQKFQ